MGVYRKSELSEQTEGIEYAVGEGFWGTIAVPCYTMIKYPYLLFHRATAGAPAAEGDCFRSKAKCHLSFLLLLSQLGA